MNFLTQEGHKLRFPRAPNLGEALKAAAEFRFPRNTEKLVERAWDLAPATAKNVTKGHASERTLQKAIDAEGWGLLAELGERITGQSYEQFLEQKMEEARHEAERLEQRRARVAHMEERARTLDPMGSGAGDLQDLRPTRGDRLRDDGAGAFRHRRAVEPSPAHP